MDEIRIVDTTLRDGNTSLWAHNMTTGMMHPVLRHMDQAGFDSMEFFVSGRFKKVVREQRDDPWNDFEVLAKEIAELKSLGMESVVNLIYSVSPRHTDEYYAHKAREAAAIKPYRICFTDVAGTLTPVSTR